MEKKIKKTFEEMFGVERAKDIKERTLKTRIERGCSGKASTKEKEQLRREKISISAKKNRNSGGRRLGSGRGKKGWYKGFFCDSSWELAWVIYHIDHNIKFERNNEGFDYFFNGEIHKFHPDFIKGKIYYEIKGYKTKEVDAKIAQFPYKIIVLYEKDLKEIFDYVIKMYGKNFISLYDGEKYIKYCEKCGGEMCQRNKGKLCKKCYFELIKSKPKKRTSKKKGDNCIMCNKLISKNKTGLCKSCCKPPVSEFKFKIEKEELENLVKEYSYEKIGKMFNVSGNTVKKRAKKFNIIVKYEEGHWNKVYGKLAKKEKEKNVKYCKDCDTKLSYKNKSGYCQKCIAKYNFKLIK
jgi:hypothetical protein